MDIKALRGTYDILPPQSDIWIHIEQEARKIFSNFGYREIRTPIFEETKLFSRSIGENTDIVSKEMYTFSDRKNRSITLRPEATAPVVRAYLQYKIYNMESLSRFFYIGPMFRYERPQAGRNRQFYQLGTEVLGSPHPFYDAESISLAVTYFQNLGIRDASVKINSVGCKQCKINYSETLKNFFAPKLNKMCPDCRIRYEKNTLRLLDCKVPSCRDQIEGVPPISDNLCSDCTDHFLKVKKYLDVMDIKYIIDDRLVRGLDYYTNTIFEIIHSGLGSQDALGGGGRYNNLVEELGGPSTGAVGFAVGIDRLVIVLEKMNLHQSIDKNVPDIYILNLDETKFAQNVEIVNKLRTKNFKVDLCTETKSIKAQLRNANRLNARFVLLRGEDEIKNNIIKLKNMKENSEETISLDSVNGLVNKLIERIT